MEIATPGHIIGTLNLRSHQAVVDIPYNTRVYSILYKSSKNLLRDYPVRSRLDVVDVAEGIHPNYNGWIENLDNAIRTQFIAIEK